MIKQTKKKQEYEMNIVINVMWEEFTINNILLSELYDDASCVAVKFKKVID